MMQSEVAFFDITPIGGILTLLSEDAQQVQDAFGTIKGGQIQSIAQFVSGIIMSFIYSWKMALVSLCSIPGIFLVMTIVSPFIMKSARLKFQHIAESMTIAVRTVKGFNREEQESERFVQSTEKSSSS
jgi:ABC-type multidrug transport system fused ATPase/permease subunit